MRDIAARFHVSDVGLKKICARADISTPYRGYWAKLAAGKRVFKAPLGPRPPGLSYGISIGTGGGTRSPTDPETELAKSPPLEPVFSEPLQSVEARIRSLFRKAPFVRSLDQPHPEIGKRLQWDADQLVKWRWHKPLFDSPFEQRRLKLLNSLFLALAGAGMRLSIGDKAARHTSVQICDTYVRFHLDHPRARKPDPWDETYIHGGKVDLLRLEIRGWDGPDRQTVWQETDADNLERHLAEIAVTLVLVGEVIARRYAMQAYQRGVDHRKEMALELERRRVEAERQERKRLAELERERRDALLAQAHAWRTAEDIRAFVALAVERAGHAASDASLRRWKAWALGVAERMDPLNSLAISEIEPDLTGEDANLTSAQT